MAVLDVTIARNNDVSTNSRNSTQLSGSYSLPMLHSAHCNRISDIDRTPSAYSRAMYLATTGTAPQTDPVQSKHGVKLYPLYDAEIVGDRRCGLTIKNNEIITDSARGHLEPDRLIKRFNEFQSSDRNLRTLEGEYISLVGNGADNFWHWVVEYLPKIELAEAAGFKGIYLVPPDRAFVAESLELLSIAPDRIQPFTGGTWKPDVLYVPEHLPVWADEMRKGDSHAHLALLRDVRTKLLDAAHRRGTEKELPPNIWVKRKNTTRSHAIINNSQVEAFIEQKGFLNICSTPPFIPLSSHYYSATHSI